MDKAHRQLPEPASRVLARCIAGHPDANFHRTLRLFTSWPEVVGAKVARRTRPYALQRRVLWVESEDATWQSEMVYLRPTLIAQLNAKLGADLVGDIKVRCGLTAPPHAAPPPRSPPNARDQVEAATLAAGIGDREVREAFAAMIAGQRARLRSSTDAAGAEGAGRAR